METETRSKIRPRPIRFYDEGISYLKHLEVKGRLIVIEGPDGSGRSTNIEMIMGRLEAEGHAVVTTGLKRSELVGPGILEAKRNLSLGDKTFTLFYAADFADRLEHNIIPALRAGYVVLADRYIYTLMARSAVRGISKTWSHRLFGFAIKPDLAFYLDVKAEDLFHRIFQKYGFLDYYESGGDIEHADNLYTSFIRYQKKMAREFRQIGKKYGIVRINGERTISEVNDDLQRRINDYLNSQT
jgi:dTMP kinase